MIEHTPDTIDGDESVHITILDMKLGEVIDELNMLQGLHDLLGSRVNDRPESSAKRTITTPPGRELHLKNNGEADLVLSHDLATGQSIRVSGEGVYVTETPPEKENNFTLEHQGICPEPLVIKKEDYTIPPEKEETPIITIEKLLEAGIADYKKRIINLLWDEHRFDTEEEAGLYKAIKLIREVE